MTRQFWDEDSPNNEGFACIGNTVAGVFGGDDFGWFDAKCDLKRGANCMFQCEIEGKE